MQIRGQHAVQKRDARTYKRKCKFCGKELEIKKEARPAYEKMCCKCTGSNHFACISYTKTKG